MGQPPNTEELSTLRSAIQTKAIHAAPKDRIIGAGGHPLGWSFDLRPILLDPKWLAVIATEFWRRFGHLGPLQIAGIESASISLMTALVLRGDAEGRAVNGLVVRKERKTTGLGRSVEGVLGTAPVIVVDDLMNHGQTLSKALETLTHAGLRPIAAFVLIDFGSYFARRDLQDRGISLEALFTIDAFEIPNRRETEEPPHFRASFRKTWHYAPNSGHPYHQVPKSTPIVSEDRIYYGCDDNKLRCIDLATGQLLWSFQAKGVTSKGIMSSPAIHEGNIYFGAYNGDVYCLNTRGDLVWRAPLCERIGSSPLILPDHRSLVIGLEYQRPGIKGSLAALDLLTGDKKWEQPLTAYQHGSAEYARSLDRIVYGTNEGRLVAADAGSGETVWEFRTQGEIKYKPAIDEPADLVACASFDGGIYANRLSTGAPVFKVQTSNICYTTPLIHGGRIYCGSGDRFFYVIDAETGEIVKKIDCHGRIFSSPRAVGPHIIFGCNTGQLVELDPVTLSVAGMFQLPDSITNTVTALDHGRRIFVSTYMNDLFSLEHKLE